MSSSPLRRTFHVLPLYFLILAAALLVARATVAHAQLTDPTAGLDYGSNVAGYLFADQLAQRTNPAFDRSIAATPAMGWNSWNVG